MIQAELALGQVHHGGKHILGIFYIVEVAMTLMVATVCSSAARLATISADANILQGDRNLI
ncbi:MAG: hypothetical protein MZV64_60220 [Ignavibacteriales bacterium]|nr:hypothetical protein [Ignavibacteriales bacterium]